MPSKIHTPSQHTFFAPLDQGTLTSSNGTGLDTLGYEEVLLQIVATTSAASTLDAKLQESDDNSTFADVSGATIAQVPASQTKASRVMDVKCGNGSPRKRYLRLVYTVTGTVTGAATANLFMPEAYPVTQTNAVVRVV